MLIEKYLNSSCLSCSGVLSLLRFDQVRLSKARLYNTPMRGMYRMQ
jgi:hypothetical protein